MYIGDEWVDGQMDGKVDSWANGGWKYFFMNEWWVERWIDGWTDVVKWIYRWINGGWKYGLMNEWWMDRWMDKWWMDL